MSRPSIVVRPALPAARLARRGMGLGAAALLAACANLPRSAATEPPLPPLAAGMPEAGGTQSQVLAAAFGDQEITLNCGESTGATDWRSVCLDPLGQRVFTLALSASGELTAERGTGVPAALDARRVLADVQLARWPLASLDRAFAGSRWGVAQVSPDTRRLTLDGRLHSEVHYASAERLWRGPHWLVNVQQGYTLAIRPEVP